MIRIFNLIFGFPNTTKLGDKDPKDYKKCKLSTEWKSDDLYCSRCKCSTGHNEFMSDICNSCGGFDTQVRYGRTFRKIHTGGKWVYQVKYKRGHEEIIDKWYSNNTTK